MITKHLTIVLLLVASLAGAGPALAQTDPCTELSRLADLSKLGDLSKLRDLSRLGDLSSLAQISELAALSQLESLSQLTDLSQLGRLPQIRDLSHLRGLARSRTFRLQGQATRRRGPEQTERVTKSFHVGPNATLYLSNISGDITIKAGAGAEIVVDATKRTPQGPDAQRQLAAVTVEAVQQAGRVDVRTRYPERGSNIRTSVDYSVTVPAGTALDVHSVSGDIQVTGVKGNLRTDCISGDVHIEGADQIEQVKNVSGDVTVDGSAGTDVRISSISGDLTLRNVKARSIDASTVSGGLKLTDVTADRMGVKTMSGDVDYVGPFARSGHYEFTAHSGDVRLTPTSSTGFEIDAQTFSGDIRSDLAITLRQGEVQPRHGRHEMKGTYGDGSALVTVHTFNGDVIITKR